MKTMTEKKREYRAMDRASGKKRIYVTLSAEEYKFLLLKADMAGVKPTPYFRDVALIEIRRVGNNLNQIAHNANAGMSVSLEETKYQLRDLENVVMKFFGR